MSTAPATREPKPEWLKVRAPGGEHYSRLKSLFRGLGLHTVCEEARCPNIAECWNGGTATLMLMGDTCTRACRFCNVKTGNPHGLLDPDEPFKVAEAINQLNLTYLVLTSVDRDDLPDGGADHFSRTVEALKVKRPDIFVEVLIPDFNGDESSLQRIAFCGADVIAHNLETVKRLTPTVRDRRCEYDKSLRVLRQLKEINGRLFTKSSLMLGTGETETEIYEAMDDLIGVGTDILTLGQYLRPSEWHLPVQRYVAPQEFVRLKNAGEQRGFRFVAAGPLARSSYRAGEFFLEKMVQGERGS